MKKMVVLLALILALVGFGSNVFADFNGIVLPELPYTYNGHIYNAGISYHYYPNGLYAYTLCEVPFVNLKLSNQAGGIIGGCPAGSWHLYSGWSYSNAFTPMNEGTGGLGFGYTSNPGGASDNYIQTSQDILSDDMQSVYFKANLSSPLPFVVAPLDDEEGLIMTMSDYSNFATLEYFNVLRINHSGVDLALSPTGTRTASQITAGKSVYPICDGTVEYIHNGGGLYSFVKIRHPNCNGQEVVAYYGHIAVIDGLTEVKTDEPIGTVKDWRGNSHLHLTIDTQTERNLSRINQVVCDYTLDANQTVTSLSNCSNAARKLGNNKMLLRMGWGQVKIMSYKDSNGHTYKKNLYISESAMRQLGFISFFDLY